MGGKVKILYPDATKNTKLILLLGVPWVLVTIYVIDPMVLIIDSTASDILHSFWTSVIKDICLIKMTVANNSNHYTYEPCLVGN